MNCASSAMTLAFGVEARLSRDVARNYICGTGKLIFKSKAFFVQIDKMSLLQGS